MLPDDVLDAMADHLPWGDGNTRREHLVWALEAAQQMGWKLMPVDPSDAMVNAFKLADNHGKNWRAAWALASDVAPKVNGT